MILIQDMWYEEYYKIHDDEYSKSSTHFSNNSDYSDDECDGTCIRNVSDIIKNTKQVDLQY